MVFAEVLESLIAHATVQAIYLTVKESVEALHLQMSAASEIRTRQTTVRKTALGHGEDLSW